MTQPAVRKKLRDCGKIRGCARAGGGCAGERELLARGEEALAALRSGVCMCWPRERPATHAAAGAAARGVRGLGGLFHTLGSGHSAPCRLRRDGTRRFWFGGDSGAEKYILENYLKREFKSMIQAL